MASRVKTATFLHPADLARVSIGSPTAGVTALRTYQRTDKLCAGPGRSTDLLIVRPLSATTRCAACRLTPSFILPPPPSLPTQIVQRLLAADTRRGRLPCGQLSHAIPAGHPRLLVRSGSVVCQTTGGNILRVNPPVKLLTDFICRATIRTGSHG